MSLIESLRQLQFPEEFRIEETTAPSDPRPPADIVARIEAVARELDVASSGEAFSADDSQILRPVANEVWRLEKRVRKLEESDPRVVRGLKPILNVLMRTLEERDVRFIDRTGDRFDPDELWDEVVGAESDAGEVYIVRMLRPRILCRGVVLQRGSCQVEEKG